MRRDDVTAIPTSDPRSRARLRLVLVWLVVLGGLMTVVGLAWRGLGPSSGAGFGAITQPAAPIVIDEPAPDFELPLLGEDGSMSLSSLRGNVVVLNFWASWCAPCRQEAPGLQATSERYADRGVRFLGVDYLDQEAAGLTFARELGIAYPSVSDPSGTLGDDFRFLGLPVTIVVDDQGVMRFRFEGYVTERSLRDALDIVLGPR